MRILFLLLTVFLVLFQAVPGNAQVASDTLACARSGGSCNFGPCRPPSVLSGTCKEGTLNCCRWSHQSGA